MADFTTKMPIKATPYKHQQAAFEFACRKFGLLPSESSSGGVALLMEMGCGKTITVVAICGELRKAGKIKRVLIVAPLLILSVWKEEYEKFADIEYELIVLEGPTKKKVEQLKAAKGKKLQVVVVNYESA